MKKSFFALFLFISVNFCFSQKPALEKIGGYKMYDSVKSLTDLGLTEIEFKKKKDVSNFYYTFNPKSKNLLAEYNYIFLNNIDAISIVGESNVYLNPKVRKFVVRKLELIPNLILKEVELVYFNDSLVSFSTSSILNKASMYLKDYSYESITNLTKMLNDKYEYSINSTTKKTETTLDKTSETTSFEYKTKWTDVKCMYSIRTENNSLNETINTYFNLDFFDEKKMREIMIFEYQLKQKKDLEKFDTKKL